MNYQDTIHYLYNKLPLYSQVGAKAYKADLTNTIKLCEFLGNPQHKIKTVHVAGTNGKGSTSHMLAAIFQQNNYKTGLYTSPHLKDFRERIKINGAMIPEEFVIDFVQRIQEVSETIQPSFFELTFAMSLDYFAQQGVEVAIIETGLGGRLDSTNVITPVLSVITNIGWDHMDILGDTLEKIAFEKAGIIKENIPVVIGEFNEQTRKVFEEKAGQTRSDIFFANENYLIKSFEYSDNNLTVSIINQRNKETETYSLDLNGLYQEKNLLTVLTAVDELKKYFSFDEEKIKQALSNVKVLTGLRGRWEVINTGPLVVLDVAHNIGGISELMHQVEQISFKKLHIVFGMVRDKDIQKVLQILPASAEYYFTKSQIPRALPERELQQQAEHFGLYGNNFPDVNEALKAASDKSSKGDVILICGSVFVIAEVDESIISELFNKKRIPLADSQQNQEV